jgi:hypothetical protein
MLGDVERGVAQPMPVAGPPRGQLLVPDASTVDLRLGESVGTDVQARPSRSARQRELSTQTSRGPAGISRDTSRSDENRYPVGWLKKTDLDTTSSTPRPPHVSVEELDADRSRLAGAERTCRPVHEDLLRALDLVHHGVDRAVRRKDRHFQTDRALNVLLVCLGHSPGDPRARLTDTETPGLVMLEGGWVSSRRHGGPLQTEVGRSRGCCYALSMSLENLSTGNLSAACQTLTSEQVVKCRRPRATVLPAGGAASWREPSSRYCEW